MPEGDCRKRKFVCFIFLTAVLIFVGMYIQYKMKVLELPLSSRFLRVGSTKLFTGVKSKKKSDNEEEDVEDEDEEIERYMQRMKDNLTKTTLKTSQNSVQNHVKTKPTNTDNQENISSKLLSSNSLDGLLHNEDFEGDNVISIGGKGKTSIMMWKIPTTESTNKHSNVIISKKIPKIGEFKKRFPKAIIAGVKKGGTRAILSFLAKHPLIRSAGKEMHFFDKHERYARGLSYYLDQMPKSFENELTIEKTPGYFVKPYVPERIYKFNKKVKLIFIFRDPVQRAISDFAQALTKEGKEGKRFEKLVFTKGASNEIKPRQVDIKNSKVSIGLYVEHLKNWLQYFPLKQMYFVNGDEFIENPVKEIKNVQRFLNLPVLIDKESFFFNKTKGFFCIIVKREGDGSISSDCLGSSKGRKHPSIRESTIEKLTEFYKPYNKRLYSLVKKDFHWPT